LFKCTIVIVSEESHFWRKRGVIAEEDRVHRDG